MIKITTTDTEVTYNGDSQVIKDPTITINGNALPSGKSWDDYVKATYSENNPTNWKKDGYTVTFSLVDPDIYEFANDSATSTKLIINKLAVSISPLVKMDYVAGSRKWDNISSYICTNVSIIDTTTGEAIDKTKYTTFGVTVVGMQNGIYKYSSDDTYNNTTYSTLTTTTNVVGSTYQVTLNLAPTAVQNFTFDDGINYLIFKYNTAMVGTEYFTIEDAFGQTGTISFIGDNSGAETYVATSFTNLSNTILDILADDDKKNYCTDSYALNGRTLVVPHKANSTDNYESGEVTKSSGYVYATLIIPSRITITLSNGATMTAAAYIGYNQPNTTIACERGVIMNDGYIDVSSGCSLNAYGFIKGTGEIYLRDGSNTMDLIATYDWVGGNVGSKIYKTVFPANAWTCHNISCDTYIYAGALYSGSMHVIMNYNSLAAAPVATGLLIGNSSSSNCLFQPTGSTGYIKKSSDRAQSWKETDENYNALNTITGSNQIPGQRDMFEMYGNYTDNQLNIELSLFMIFNVDFSTSTSISAPLPFTKITVKKGSNLELTSSDYLLLPGSSVIVEEGAKLTIGAGVDVAISTWDSMKGFTSRYGFASKCVDKWDAELIVNGEVTVNGSIGGYITTESSSAKLVINGSNKASYITIYDAVATAIHNSNVTARGPMKTASDPIDRTISTGTFYSDGEAWFQDTCHIEYDSNGGNESYANSDDKPIDKVLGYEIKDSDIPSTKPTREHYTFGGWYTDPNGTEGNEAVGSTTFSTIVLYAKWIPNTYYINFHITDETGDNLGEITVESIAFNITSIVNIDEYKNGNYVFDGWYGDSTMTTKISQIIASDYSTQLLETGTIELYGTLLDENTKKYTLSFITNNPDFQYSSQTVVSTKPTIYSIPNIATEVNYDTTYKTYFMGWYTDSSFSNPFEEGTEITQNTTLYGKWSNKIKLTLYCNAEKIIIEGVEVPYIELYYMPDYELSLPTLKSYDLNFDNEGDKETMIWFTNESLDSSVYYVGGHLYKFYEDTNLYGEYYYLVTSSDFTNGVFNKEGHENIILYNIDLSNIITLTLTVETNHGLGSRSWTASKTGGFYNKNIKKIVLNNATLPDSKYYTANAKVTFGSTYYCYFYMGVFDNNPISQVITDSTSLKNYIFSNNTNTSFTWKNVISTVNILGGTIYYPTDKKSTTSSSDSLTSNVSCTIK